MRKDERTGLSFKNYEMQPKLQQKMRSSQELSKLQQSPLTRGRIKDSGGCYVGRCRYKDNPSDSAIEASKDQASAGSSREKQPTAEVGNQSGSSVEQFDELLW